MEWMSIRGTATYLRISTTAARRLIKSGWIPARKLLFRGNCGMFEYLVDKRRLEHKITKAMWANLYGLDNEKAISL